MPDPIETIDLPTTTSLSSSDDVLVNFSGAARRIAYSAFLTLMAGASGLNLGTAALSDDGDFDAAGAASAAVTTANVYTDSTLASWTGSGNVTALGTVTSGNIDAILPPGIAATGDPIDTTQLFGTAIPGSIGGTGVANSGKTITLGGNLATSGSFALTFTLTAATGVTLPTSGTLATLAGSESLTNKKLGSLTTNGLVTTSSSDGTLSVTVPAVNVLTFLATPTSANLLAAVTNETGTGALVFATSPTLVTPVLGVVASGDITACTGRLFGIGAALSDLTAATTGAKSAETIGIASKIISIYLNAITAPAGSTLIVDIKKNGTTIFSTKISIDSGETNSATAATPYVLAASPTNFAAGDVLSYEVFQIGSGTAGAGVVCDILLATI